MKAIGMLLLIGSMATTGHAQAPNPHFLHGRWAGTATQEGMRQHKGEEFSYTLDLHIVQILEHEHSGTARVLEVGCEADLVFRHYANEEYLFFAQPVKKSPPYCIPALIRLRVLPRDKVAYTATYNTPANPRHPGLQGTLSRLISIERREQVEQ